MKNLFALLSSVSLLSCTQNVKLVSVDSNTKQINSKYAGMSYNEMMFCKEIDSWTPEQKALFIKTFVYTEKDIKELDSLLRK